MRELCDEIELVIDEDYRKSALNIHDRFFYPLNEETNFKINQIFRKLTKDKIRSSKNLKIKGRTMYSKKLL